MTDQPVSVSINGIDNVGKSTQLAWLHRGIPGAHAVGSVDSWNARWKEIAAGDFAHWWFVGSATTEHVELMLRSHWARRSGSGRLALEDRGLPMLRAACAATSIIKERISALEALQLVDRIAADLPAAQPRCEIHILLRRSGDPVQEALEALRREHGRVGERYAAYQHALAEALALQAEGGEYDAVLTIGDASILDVQRQLRSRLADFGIPVHLLPGDLPHRLWVLAGMSESGKSTVGGLLRDEHGVTRLKIGYLLEVAALRAGVPDPYQWPEPEQAERLSEEVLRFAATCKAPTISIESAHRFEATAHLKRVWGNCCRIVYIDADAATRASRAAETMARLSEREAIKRERGADRIAEIADHVIDNSGSLAALKLGVTRVVSITELRSAAPPASEMVTNTAWLSETTGYLLDDQVAVVLATGSTGTARWRDGWSDLDLLVVRDAVPDGWLRGTVGALPVPAGIKVAVSVFTTGDIETLRVPPRVVQSLRRAAKGDGVLYRRPGYLVPVPTRGHADRTSRGELGLVLMTCRRLLANRNLNVRDIYKHLALLVKILLRADGHDFDDAEDALVAFRDLYPEVGCIPPGLDSLINQPGDPDARAQLITTTDRLLTYFDKLDKTAGTGA